MDSKFLEKFKVDKNAVLVSFLRFFKEQYDIFFIILLLSVILAGFLIFYKFVYLVLTEPIEIEKQEVFVREDLFNFFKSYLDGKKKKFEERMNDKFLDPFR